MSNVLFCVGHLSEIGKGKAGVRKEMANCLWTSAGENRPQSSQPVPESLNLTRISSLAIFSQSRMTFCPPAAEDSSTETSMICSSFFDFASKMLLLQTGGRGTENFPVLGFFKKAWKQRLTTFRSMV